MRITVIISIILFSTFSFSQQHDALLFFGFESPDFDPDLGTFTMDFEDCRPSFQRDQRPMNFEFYSLVACDSIGNLIFYSDGTKIRNYNNLLIENGDTINPGFWYEWATYNKTSYPTGASAQFFPAPDQENAYYMIHLGAFTDWDSGDNLFTPLYFTKIDMSANNGLGRVVQVNEILKEGSFSYFGITKHANGRDWWLVTGNVNDNTYCVFLFGKNGISEFPIQHVGNFDLSEERIYLGRFNPDGSVFVRYDAQNGPILLDFDRCTGNLSNARKISIPEPMDWGWGCAFSPNSRFFYFNSINTLYQVDLQDQYLSLDTIAVYDGYAYPNPPIYTAFFVSELAPDGKIYMASHSATKVMHVIHEPNLKGSDCNMEQHFKILPAMNNGTMPHFPTYRLGPIDGSSCDTLGIDNIPLAGFRYDIAGSDVNFTSNSWYEPKTWFWEFGDGKTSDEVNPIHSYEPNMTYNVCLTVSNQYGQGTECKQVAIEPTISTSLIIPQDAILFFPNPTSDVLYIQFDQRYLDDVQMIEIVDIYGRTVGVEKEIDLSDLQIDVGSISSGTYVLHARNSDGQIVWREKFVKLPSN